MCSHDEPRFISAAANLHVYRSTGNGTVKEITWSSCWPDPAQCGHLDCQRKLLVSDPGMHHSTCVTHVPWCMPGSLTRGGGENVRSIPGACPPAILRIWQEAHSTDEFGVGASADTVMITFGLVYIKQNRHLEDYKSKWLSWIIAVCQFVFWLRGLPAGVRRCNMNIEFLAGIKVVYRHVCLLQE